jgi:hypothetical protein
VGLVAVVGNRVEWLGQAACRIVAAHGEPVGIARIRSGMVGIGPWPTRQRTAKYIAMIRNGGDCRRAACVP